MGLGESFPRTSSLMLALRPAAPGRLRLPAGGAGLRRSLAPVAALQPAARTSVLFHRLTCRDRRARNRGIHERRGRRR